MDNSNPLEFELLPEVYQKWADDLLSSRIPREREATCSRCAMCASAEGPLAGVTYFRRSLKCCTFFPRLPNFLVGRALERGSPAAHRLRSFLSVDNADAVATPLGVFPVKRHSAIYAATAKGGFGNDPALLCPYAVDAEGPEGPHCGIWGSRNAVCTTYFCKHVRGETGQLFWHSLRSLLVEMESALAWWAVAELLPGVGELLVKRPMDDSGSFELPGGDGGWRQWQGTRESFYRVAAERVEALRWDDALAIAGIKANMRAKEVAARFRASVSSTVPPRVRVATFHVVSSGRETTVLQTPQSKETFRVPSSLLPVLACFDGRPTEMALAEIEERAGIRVSPALVVKLCDFRVLEPVENDGRP